MSKAKPIQSTPGFKTFGRWTIIRQSGFTARGLKLVSCRCECGKTKTIQLSSLTRRNNPSKSCGCLRDEISTTHGATNSDEYRAWKAMKNRCYYSRNIEFQHYGGRGIVVCERWINSFENFLADMGPRPSKRHSLDRFPNVNGNYEPSNCRWATSSEQHRNRRNNHLIAFDGQTKCLTEWAELYGISASTLYNRIKKGMPIQTALTIKLHTRTKHAF